MSSAFAVSRSTAEPFDPQCGHLGLVQVTASFREPQQFSILPLCTLERTPESSASFRAVLQELNGGCRRFIAAWKQAAASSLEMLSRLRDAMERADNADYLNPRNVTTFMLWYHDQTRP